MGTREKRGLSIWLVEKSSGGLWRGVEGKQEKRENSCAGLTIREDFKSFGRGNKSPCCLEKKRENACTRAFVSPFLIDKETRLIQKDSNYRFISISLFILKTFCNSSNREKEKRVEWDHL